MIWKRKLIFCILFLNTIFVYGQYINTDSMIIVPGETFPFSISEVKKQGINLSGACYDQSLTTGIMFSKFEFPVHNKIISRFGPRRGRMHNGLDIRSATGDTICAAFNGQIISSRYY